MQKSNDKPEQVEGRTHTLDLDGWNYSDQRTADMSSNIFHVKIKQSEKLILVIMFLKKKKKN